MNEKEKNNFIEGPYVLGIGACNADVYGKSLIPIRTHYDHPAKIESAPGGVMYNIISNIARLGGKVRLISAYGDDPYGQMILQGFEKSGIDPDDSLLVKGATSGIFMQVQDENNDMYLAVCDMSILQNLDPAYIESKKDVILNARIVVVDPSIRLDSIEKILAICRDKVPVYIDPISDNYALKIAPYAGDFTMIKPNRKELASLAAMEVSSDLQLERACRKLLEKGLKKIVVSLSQDGILYMDENNTVRRKLKPEDHMVNASGAGDALMAAFIYSTVQGIPLDETLDLALAAGIAAIRSETAINEDLSLDLLKEIIREKKK